MELHKNLRRLYEAAKAERNPDRFFSDLREAFEKKELRPSEFSIRRLVEEFVPDGRELVESWNPAHGQRMGSSTPSLARILEADAVGTAAFSNISGQIVYNELLAGFQLEEFKFSALIPTVQTQFNGEKIAGIGGLGDKGEVVSEKGEYPRAGTQEDWIRTPETVKRGLIVEASREAV